MPILIRNGRVITEDMDRITDIYCEDSLITRIETEIPKEQLPNDTQIIDATNKYVFPGFIDPHVHIHLPFMGSNAIDTHLSASKAALAGGTTTLIEMICPGPNDEPLDAFNEWNSLAQSNAAIDYSFHMAVVRFDELAREQLKQIVLEQGIASFKVFLAYKGALNLSESDLFDLLTLAKELGVITTAHCENADLIDSMQQQLIAQGCTDPQYHGRSRPPSVEALGIHQIATFARLTDAHVYAVHTSCEDALKAALQQIDLGAKLWVESVAPHFVLDETLTELPNFEGAKYVMSPPLRDKSNQAALWNGVNSGLISTIGTDHAPFSFLTQKILGKDVFTQIPNGIPSIQERVDLLHTFGVLQEKFDLQTLVRSCSTNAAKIFGLYPQKGDLKIGSDADIVVYAPNCKHTLSVDTSESLVDYNAYEGWELTGRAEIVIARGKIQARDGRYIADSIGTQNKGRLLKRKPTHF